MADFPASLRPARRRWLGACAAGATLLAVRRPGWAAAGGLPTNVGHTDSSPQWELLRAKLFGDRAIQPSPSQIKLIVPLRAAYGASVPVKVQAQIPQTERLHVKRLTLLVDKNPSPVAAQLELSVGLGQADFETRLRVDEYSHVRVVAELSNGELHTDSRYVKVSGGCSAPPNRDTPELIGRTTMRLPEGLHPGAPTPVDLSVVHPNDTGFELNQISLLYIPSHFVRSVRVAYGGRPLFQAETDFSISENPSWRFQFVPRESGVLTAEVDDSHESHYRGMLDPHAAAAAVAAS